MADVTATGQEARLWETFLTSQEIEKIQQQQTIQREELAAKTAFNERLFNLYQGQLNDFKTQFGANPASVPESFKTAANLFQPGGQYGEGARAEVQRGANQALAAGQIGLTQTGMSSGTNVAGLRARVASDSAINNAKIEDQRIQLLAGSLTNLGQAGLETQKLSSQERTSLMQTLAYLRPTFQTF